MNKVLTKLWVYQKEKFILCINHDDKEATRLKENFSIICKICMLSV